MPLAFAIAHDTGVNTALTNPWLAYAGRGEGFGFAKVDGFIGAVGNKRIYLGGFCAEQGGKRGFGGVLHGVSPSVGDTMG